MLWLIVGLIAFLGTHLVPSAPGVRQGLVARLGENGYRIGFSVLSVATLVLLVWGFARSPVVEVWPPPAWTRYATAVLMAVAMVVLMAAFFPGHIKRRLKHPMLVAIKVWAVAHLLANGDLASILLFGGFLVYAGIDRVLVGVREERVPVQATASAHNDIIAVAVGLAIYALFVWRVHLWLTGLPVLP